MDFELRDELDVFFMGNFNKNPFYESRGTLFGSMGLVTDPEKKPEYQKTLDRYGPVWGPLGIGHMTNFWWIYGFSCR